jgi:hypothetical protein
MAKDCGGSKLAHLRTMGSAMTFPTKIIKIAMASTIFFITTLPLLNDLV